MNDLWQKINKDLISAMKEKREQDVSVLRMLVAALKNKKIAFGNKDDLSEEQVLEVVKSEVKKRKDSVAEYTRGNRQDLADKELAEIKIIEGYMPEQMSDEEVEKEDTHERKHKRKRSDNRPNGYTGHCVFRLLRKRCCFQQRKRIALILPASMH